MARNEEVFIFSVQDNLNPALEDANENTDDLRGNVRGLGGDVKGLGKLAKKAFAIFISSKILSDFILLFM